MHIAWLALGGMLCSLQLSTGSFPRPLSPKEEQHYLERAAAGDLEARNVLVERNLRLVAHIMKKYYASESDQEDLISIGTIGLIKAANSYRLDKNIKFATYASRCIENEILMYFRSRRKNSQDVSLSELIETGTDGAALELQDVVAGEEDLLEELSARENGRRLRAAVEAVLTDQEKEVVCTRYGLFGRQAQKQREVAALLGISRSYVSRIEKRALERLREALQDHI
ncbi:MAG: RNA polymerase sporulation sigma factor SigK [Oscillospiraceae bacterium]|nr:RNA polymerase sporulation sigma factor SigK [Oscillospiraceae bacterium]